VLTQDIPYAGHVLGRPASTTVEVFFLRPHLGTHDMVKAFNGMMGFMGFMGFYINPY